jgi:hypothetical protein
MSAPSITLSGPLSVRVKEPSDGLFYWVVTQLSAEEHTADIPIDTSDHPYPTHEAALSAGVASLKVLKSEYLSP